MNDPRPTRSRPIVATFHRKAGRRTKPGETRRYAKIDNALTGKPLGSVKIKAGGKLDSWFLWEK